MGSLRVRLPLLILALLSAIGGAFAWMAYREVEHALRASGLERAAGAATQVGDLLSQAVAARAAETHRLAATADVRAIARARAVPQNEIPAALVEFLTRNQQAFVSLYDAEGKPISTVARASDGRAAVIPFFDAAAPRPGEGVSALRVHEGRVGYAVTAPITADKQGDAPLGHLLVWRTLRSSGGTGLIERLIGSGAAIRLGNVDGDVWTDLNAAVAPPHDRLSGPTARYARDGQMRLGASVPIAGAPWVVWADLSEASMLAPARVLVKHMAPITLLIAVLGALAVYIVSARVTRPLEQAAHAAQAIAAGDYSVRVDARRGDEIGRVGAAFNVMAARVGESHEALEARVRMRTEELESFSYSVSHDLRAPLRHIIGFAALLQKSGAPNLTAQDRRYLDTIAEAAARMSRLVDDLLQFSRMARAEVHQSVVDCDVLVREVIAEHALDAAGREVDWEIEPLPAVRADRAMLKVVLGNLVSNALKYTRTRDRARIEIKASPAVNGDRVVFVRDNGVGFDMKYSDKLFGVFQRLHSAEEFEGTGIGLASVRRIVQRHGGRAWAEGAEGAGATFYISIPGHS